MLDELALQRARYWSVNARLADTKTFMFSVAEHSLIRDHELGLHEYIIDCPICNTEVEAIIQGWKDDSSISPYSGRRVIFTRDGVPY